MKSITHYSRYVTLAVIVIGITTALAWNLVNIQVLNEDKAKRNSSSSYIETHILPSKRGIITDARDTVLVSNVFTCSLIADKYHLSDPRMAASGIAYSHLFHTEEWQNASSDAKLKQFNALRRRILHDVRKDDSKANEEGIFDHVENVINAFADSSQEDTSQEDIDTTKVFDKEKLKKLIETNEEYALGFICGRLSLNKDEMLTKLRESKNKRVVLAQNIPDEQIDALKNELRELRIEGFSFDYSARRQYSMPTLMPHVVGYTNIEGNGTGVEQTYNEYLAGQDGFRRFARDSRQLPLPSPTDALKKPTHGLNLKLTIDCAIQAMVEEELDQGLAEFESERGAVVMVDPKTGDIMAMACRPAFNLNSLSQEELSKGSLNFCTQSAYEPGSTFKIVAVSSGLDIGKVNLNTIIPCGGKHFSRGAITITDTSSYGSIPVQKVITKSSNIGSFLIAERGGPKNFIEYLQKFGFGQKTGIRLPGESKGVMLNVNNSVDFSRMAMGYAVSTTPLQIAMAYAAIANDGVLMKPRIVQRIFDMDNKTMAEDITKPQEVGRVISSKTAKEMRQALQTVTEQGGTALRARVEGFNIGGKTGTARRHVEGKGYVAGQYTVSFVGIMPIEDPAFVCIVVVDNPRTTKVTHYGGTVAAPIYAKIAKRTADILNLTPTNPVKEKITLAQSPETPRKSNR